MIANLVLASAGVISLLCYGAVSLTLVSPRSRRYHLLNLTASVLGTGACVALGAWGGLPVNLGWGVIALLGLGGVGRK